MQPNHQPQISFIVPIYNVEEYLEECLESILKQDVDKEIILVDDGSTDNSQQIAKSYVEKYPFITLIYSQNQGLSAARNKGLRLAKGEYIHFVDSDDYLLGNHFSVIYQLAEQAHAEIIRIQILSQTGDKTHPILSLTDKITPTTAFLFTPAQAFEQILHRSSWIPMAWAYIFKRSFIQTHQLAFYEGLKAEDNLFLFQALTTKAELNLLEYPDFVYLYRQREGSITQKGHPKFVEDHFEIMNLMKAHYAKSPIQCDEAFQSIIKQIKLWASYALNKLDDADQKRYLPLFKQD